MFAAIKRLFVTPSIDDLLDDAERSAAGATLGAVRGRHAGLEERVRKATAGMDPAALVMLLVQMFGPWVVAMIERWLARRGG